MAKPFTELKVWQCAADLNTAVYTLTEDFPVEEVFGLTAQLRRASVAVPTSIASGWGRQTRGDLRLFLTIARGTNTEVRALLAIAHTLHIGDRSRLAAAAESASEVGRRLDDLLRQVNTRSSRAARA